MIKTLLTDKYGVIEAEIDSDLQINNQYTEWGMFLINVENGVVWGYDVEKYMYKDNRIVKKPANEEKKSHGEANNN